MSSRFAEIDRIFRGALRIEPDGRHDFVVRQCNGDRELLSEVLELLEEDEASVGAGPLDRPALGEGFALSDFAPGDSANQPPLPESIGKYRVRRLLGVGGMGIVYEAEQSHPRRTVALKVINAGVATPEMLQRFHHEAEVLARLQHPGIAQIYEAGTFDSSDSEQLSSERPYFAMELVHGEPVNSFVSKRNLGVRERLEVIAGICDAVQHAHQRGVIHRDLKPGNILVEDAVDEPTAAQDTARSRAGSVSRLRAQPKILDFGIARATDHDRQTASVHTQDGQLLGTLPYMSPEQATGQWDAVDTRSDVYTLGVIAYEVLGERLPYDVRDQPVAAAVHTISQQPPSSLSTVDRRLAGDVETIIGKALEKDRSRRYQSASEFASDIRRYLADEPIQARPPSALYQLRKMALRHKPVVIGASIAGIVAIASVIVISFALASSIRDRNDLRRQTAIASAVNAFLNEDILAAASSDLEDRSSVTVRQVLDEASEAIEAGRFDDEPAVEAAIRLTIGRTYRDLGELERAEPHLEESLDLHLLTYPRESEPVTTAMNELGKLYSAQDRPEEIIALWTEVLELKRTVFGESHQTTIISISNLGSIYREPRRYAEALPLHEEAHRLAVRYLPPDNEWRIVSTRHLASMYRDLERYAEAEPLFAESIDAMREHFGPHHNETLRAMNSLSLMYQDIDRYEDAERILREILATFLDRADPGHPNALAYRHNLGVLLLRTDRESEAVELFEENLPLMYQTLGRGHRGTIFTSMSLAEAYDDRGRAQDADRMLASVLDDSERLNGEDHIETLRIIERTLDVYLDRRDTRNALATSEQLLSRATGALPENDLSLAGFFIMRGEALELDEQTDAAIAPYERALAIYESFHGPDHPRTTNTRDTIERLTSTR